MPKAGQLEAMIKTVVICGEYQGVFSVPVKHKEDWQQRAG